MELWGVGYEEGGVVRGRLRDMLGEVELRFRNVGDAVRSCALSKGMVGCLGGLRVTVVTGSLFSVGCYLGTLDI